MPEAPVKPSARPWYKRMWGGGSAKAATPAPVKVDAAPEPKPEPTKIEAEPDLTKPVAGAQSEARPWYKRGWKKRPKPVLEDVKADPPEAKSEAAVTEEAPPEVPEQAKGMFSASGEPLIKVGYSLKFSVSAGGRTEVADQVKTVSDKGAVSMPLVGLVACEGLTLKELSERLEKQYSQFIRDPLVSVDFSYEGRAGEISPWGVVVVYGVVRQPGLVNIPPTRDLTVSRAIQMAGGADRVANQEKIKVSRLAKDGTKQTIIVDLQSVAEKGIRENDIKLEPGDVINVPEKIW